MRRIWWVGLLISWAMAQGLSWEEQKEQALTKFDPGLVQRLQADASALVPPQAHFRPFSSCQYGRHLVRGELVELGDVYDARSPEALERFRQWAEARPELLRPGVGAVDRLAPAAHRFFEEMGFDAVLFRPDEFHPVFTRPDDTWMFLHERGLKVCHSRRIQKRRHWIEGGMDMGGLAGTSMWVPRVPGYERYHAVAEAPVSDGDGTGAPAVSEEQRARREAAGFVASPLSGRRRLSVATWTPWDREMVKLGFRFEGRELGEDRFTWGSQGHYLVVLEDDFW